MPVLAYFRVGQSRTGFRPLTEAHYRVTLCDGSRLCPPATDGLRRSSDCFGVG